MEGETKEEYVKRVRDLQAEARGRRSEDVRLGRVPVSLEVDDYGFLLPGHDALLTLRKSWPGLNVTCFTIPLPKEFFTKENSKHFTWNKYRKWADMVNSLDWLDVAVHGFSHTHFECEVGYGDAMTMIDAVEKLFGRIGLRYEKMWRAPYWQMSYSFMRALKDRGWVICTDRNFPRPVPEGAKEYRYNWSINEPLPPSGKAILGHAHFEGNNANNINGNLAHLMRELPSTARFVRLSEQEYGK